MMESVDFDECWVLLDKNGMAYSSGPKINGNYSDPADVYFDLKDAQEAAALISRDHSIRLTPAPLSSLERREYARDSGRYFKAMGVRKA